MALVRYKKNDTINNPRTGTPIFGMFPEIVHQKVKFEAGPIYLRYGEHRGAHRGFGLVHVWREHGKEIRRETQSPLLTVEEAIEIIPGYVAGLLIKGAPIHSEFDQKMRCMVVKIRKGVVLLEPFLDGDAGTYYSIVTAYGGQAKGPKIGAL